MKTKTKPLVETGFPSLMTWLLAGAPSIVLGYIAQKNVDRDQYARILYRLGYGVREIMQILGRPKMEVVKAINSSVEIEGAA